MPSIHTRRCTIDRRTDKTMYDTVVEEAQAMGDTNLGAHEINSTFFPAKPDQKGNIYYQKADGTPFVATFIAEIGSEAQGTWMAAYPKNTPPAFKLPYSDVTSKSHKMVLALRCPTGAPEPLRTMYRDGVAVCDGIREHDEVREGKKGEHFDITDWITCEEGGEITVDKMFLLARLDQTYQVPHGNNTNTSSPASRTPRPRITKVGSATNPTTLSDGAPDVEEMEATEVTERKVGDHYPPDDLPDHRGPYFAHDKAKLVQRDYKDVDGNLIAPHELYSKLTEGTLVLVTVSLVKYVITNQKSEKGEAKADRKVYHVLVDRLKILDHGDGEAWNPPIPALPERRYYSPATPKRGRDVAADAAFDGFGSRSSPSPSKRPKRNLK
ncbi:hypothetical protein B0H10DRAFT_2446512 [Mycena sp. CBHHK59/15]|nr:hypothetical protein B0H10DRAFT_2446512 [Mycena sp. CBHHK59/15]